MGVCSVWSLDYKARWLQAVIFSESFMVSLRCLSRLYSGKGEVRFLIRLSMC